MVEDRWHRSAQDCAQALEGHAWQQGPGSAESVIAGRSNRSTTHFRWCRQRSTITMAFTLALSCSAASSFHDPNGTAFADLVIDGHRETWPIRGRHFRHWLRRRYYEETDSAASAETIRSAVDLLEARAQFDAPERMVHVRVAEHDGRTYLDLADKDWRAVQIGSEGWQVIASPPVRFRRAAGMLPLPIP